MAKSSTPSSTVYPYNAKEVDNLVTRYSEVPNVAKMRSTYLFGIPLTSSLTGQTVSDEMIQTYLDSAISELEMSLDLTITPTKYSERQDWNREVFINSNAWTKLNHKPVISVSEFSIVFSNDDQKVITFPLEFVYVDSQDAAVRLVPAIGTTVQGFLQSTYAGAQMWGMYAAGSGHFPGAIRIDYIAGFENGKIPALISGLIGNIAAYKLLTNIAPLLFPYSSHGISIDGVSQSSSSPGPQFLVARISDLEKQIEKQMEIARNYFLKSFLVDYI